MRIGDGERLREKPHMIEDYQFGTMTVTGQKHSQDLKIVEGEILGGWWRKEGHSVHPEDVEDVLGVKPEFLVVGMGQPGLMQVTPELRSALADARVHLIELPTAQAVETFNELLRKGRKVAGAFHLTC